LITNIKYCKLSQGFHKFYTGLHHNQYFFFGEYNGNTYLLSDPVDSNDEYYYYPNYIPSYSGIQFKLAGRLGGVNKARSFKLGKIRTQSFNLPIEYTNHPIQTK
jgi:hypothetical protein